MVNRMRRRVKRDAGTPAIDSSDHFTSLPSKYVRSTSNMPTTNAFTTGIRNEDELSITLGSHRASHLFTATDVSTEVYRNTKDGVDEVVSPTNSSVKMVNSNVEGNFTVAYSRPTIAGLRISSEVNDEGNTLLKDNLSTTSATTKEADVALSDYMAYRLGKVINLYAQPLIAVVGVVGNTISMLVMFQPNNRRTSFGVYIRALAMSDTLVLVSSTGYWLNRLLSSTPLRDIDCKLHGYLINSLQMNGFFLILGFTLDRLVAVRFPLKALTWCGSKRAKVVSAATFTVVWLINVPFLVYNHVKNKKVCAMGEPGSVMSFVFPWIAVIVGLVIPFVSLTTMNAFIITTIINRQRKLSQYAPDRSHDASESVELSTSVSCSNQDLPHAQSSDNREPPLKPMSTRERNAIVILLLVSLTFILLVVPQFLKIAYLSLINNTQTLSQQADNILLCQVTRKLYFMNNACNFFLYCLSGTKFRNDVAKLFRCKSSTG